MEILTRINKKTIRKILIGINTIVPIIYAGVMVYYIGPEKLSTISVWSTTCWILYIVTIVVTHIATAQTERAIDACR